MRLSRFGVVSVLAVTVVACEERSPSEPDPEPFDRASVTLVVGLPQDLRPGVPEPIAITLFNNSIGIQSDVVIYWCLAEHVLGTYCSPTMVVPIEPIPAGESLRTTLMITAPVELAGDTVQLRIYQRGLGERHPFPKGGAVLLPVLSE